MSLYQGEYQASATERFGFVLLPGFSLLSFSAAVEPLHKVNQLLGRTACQPVPVSVDGQAAYSSSAVQVAVSGGLEQLVGSAALFVCGSSVLPCDYEHERSLLSWLEQQPLPPILGGIASGACLLARAGFLDGYRAVVVCPDRPASDGEVLFSRKPFELDGNRYTCRGGSAAMDMMLALIGQRQGLDLAARVARLLTRERHSQATVEAARSGPEPRLRDALDLMLANLDEPLGADELACHVGVSRRQLERLFRKNLDTAPSRYYLRLRLEAARTLLRQEDLSVVQVALACGFSNASHFSTTYRNRFNITPRQERQLARDSSLHAFRHSLPVAPWNR